MSETLARDRYRPPPGIRAILDAPAIDPDRIEPDVSEEAGGLERDFSLIPTEFRSP